MGGTGSEGSGFAMRWARAGLDVIIGSRSSEKAQRVAAELRKKLGDVKLRGPSNLEAAQMADVVVLSVPYESQEAIIESIKPGLAGKVMVTVVAPLLGEHSRAILAQAGYDGAAIDDLIARGVVRETTA
jgi:NADPH-dependent F420 reductase